MASQSLAKFDAQISRAHLLALHAGKLRKKTDAPAKLIFLHATLAAQVAAWDAYIKSIAAEYFSRSADPAIARYAAVHDLLRDRALEALKKLNTPNSGNCRDFLIKHAGFDPWPAWVGIKFGNATLSNSLIVRNRLDEIFSVRHSFAHGLTMPAHAWNSDANGVAHLTCEVVRSTQSFFSSLAKNTDSAFASHVHNQHGIPMPW